VEITFDPAKDAKNIRERGLSFTRVAEIDLNTALVLEDRRNEYGQTRYAALCYLDGRLHVLCFTEAAKGISVISFPKANAREARRHGKSQTID
jgi:uncharacterized DUF497 family protein